MLFYDQTFVDNTIVLLNHENFLIKGRIKMEQGGGISIISPPTHTDNNVGKEKSNGLSSTTTSRIMSAKEKICTPCE